MLNLFKKRIEAEDIAKAYNKHKKNLIVTKTSLCCGQGDVHLVANEMVVLRRMLEDLGFKDEEIDRVLHRV